MCSLEGHDPGEFLALIVLLGLACFKTHSAGLLAGFSLLNHTVLKAT